MRPEYIDLGAGKWRRNWITKQHIVEYLRCQYRLFLSFSEGIPIQELKDMRQVRPVFGKGLDLEAYVIENSKPRQVLTKQSLESLISKSLPVASPKVFRNHELGIMGKPDMILTNRGKYIPVEVKDHKEPTYLDELELAFYWLLLEPLRTKRTTPKGYVILNDMQEREIRLTDDHFDEVESLIDEVRGLAKTGAKPSLTRECKSCLQEKDCRKTILKFGGLTLLFDVSTAREEHFRAVGRQTSSR